MTDRQTDRQTEHELTGYPSIDKPWLKYYSDEAINAILPEKTIYHYLYDSNVNNLNIIAINYFGKKVTYRSMFNFIDEISYALKSIGGCVPVAFIQIRQNYQYGDEEKQELDRVYRYKLKAFSEPKETIVVDSIPLTGVGKVDFKKLEELAEMKR